MKNMETKIHDKNIETQRKDKEQDTIKNKNHTC